MDNIFGFFDFTRPGKGYVDDSVYPPFIRYFKRYGRNFFKLIQLNLLYAMMTLPVYVWLVSLINVVSTQSGGGILSTLGALLMYVVADWPEWLLAVLFAAGALVLGPASAALSCAALNCAWDRPGLFWPQVWEAWKGNWKQALPVGILDILVCYITLFYFVDGVAVYGSLGIVLQTCWGVLVLLYGMTRVYLYPIMVTVELPFGALLRNSLILALLPAWRPLVVLLLTGVLCIGCLLADLVLIPCFLYSLVAFTAVFLTQPIISNYLLSENS